jgi:predicted proteasome-type protease
MTESSVLKQENEYFDELEKQWWENNKGMFEEAPGEEFEFKRWKKLNVRTVAF